jgi:hypothetical protein
LLAAVAVVASIAVAAPGSASAESLCTDTFTASEGAWTTASNWSAEHVPTSSDIVCVAAGHAATISSGAQEAAVLQGEGTLTIETGSLTTSSAVEPSAFGSITLSSGTLDIEGAGLTAHALILNAGTLDGAGPVAATGFFSWRGPTMSGTGTTTIESGATALFTGGALYQRHLINHGTVSMPSGIIETREGAEITNTGTFIANFNSAITEERGPGSKLVNTGTFERTEGGTVSTEVRIQTETRAPSSARTGRSSSAAAAAAPAIGKARPKDRSNSTPPARSC